LVLGLQKNGVKGGVTMGGPSMNPEGASRLEKRETKRDLAII